MRMFTLALFLSLVACVPADPVEETKCLSENHCYEGSDAYYCEDGFTWEDPDNSDNFTCVEVVEDYGTIDLENECILTTPSGFGGGLVEIQYRGFNNGGEGLYRITLLETPCNQGNMYEILTTDPVLVTHGEEIRYEYRFYADYCIYATSLFVEYQDTYGSPWEKVMNDEGTITLKEHNQTCW